MQPSYLGLQSSYQVISLSQIKIVAYSLFNKCFCHSELFNGYLLYTRYFSRPLGGTCKQNNSPFLSLLIKLYDPPEDEAAVHVSEI